MPMRSFFFRLGAAAIGLMLLTSAYHRLNSSSLMAEAANRFLASLTPEQRAKATFAFEEDERQNWHFVPIERKGLALREMTSAQKHLATALLSAGLSQQGYLKAETIMSLEDVLRAIERKGLALREMTSAQKHLATALLSAGLSQQGYLKAETIMSLEDVLRVI